LKVGFGGIEFTVATLIGISKRELKGILPAKFASEMLKA